MRGVIVITSLASAIRVFFTGSNAVSLSLFSLVRFNQIINAKE
jgi:hypothetical protein